MREERREREAGGACGHGMGIASAVSVTFLADIDDPQPNCL